MSRPVMCWRSVIACLGTGLVIALLAACVSQPSAPSSGVGTGPFSSGNLIVNGDAESGPGTQDGGTPVQNIPGWTTSGHFDSIAYGASGGYLEPTDPGPSNRGKNFFGGGPDDSVSTGTQLIDVSAGAAIFDAGTAHYLLSGWLGGYSGQDDNAVLTIRFENSAGLVLGQGHIGPVMAADRKGETSLLQRSSQGSVPKGTRKVQVTLTMTRLAGSANDGYADNLSLSVTSPSSALTRGLLARGAVNINAVSQDVAPRGPAEVEAWTVATRLLRRV